MVQLKQFNQLFPTIIRWPLCFDVCFQHALRLVSFGRIYEVLGINPLPSVELPSHRRKRQRADCQAQQGDSASGLPRD